MLGVYLVHISVTKLVNGVIKLIQFYVVSVHRLCAGELRHANIRHGTGVGVFGVLTIKVMLHFGEERKFVAGGKKQDAVQCDQFIN